MNLKILLPLLLPICVQAQVQLKANDPLIRYDLIRSGHYYNKAIIFDSSGRVSFEWVGDHVITADTVRKDFLFVRYDPAVVGRFTIDSCWNNANGPVRYVLASYPSFRTEADIFNPTEVKAHAVRRGHASDTTLAMTVGYLDDTSIWELWGYMDLQRGVKYVMDIFGSDNRVPLKYYIELRTDDYLKNADGSLLR